MLGYWIEVHHPGLHKYRLVRGPDVQVVQALARAQAAEWDGIWSKKVALNQRIMGAYAAKEAKRLYLERQKEEATNRTAEAQQILQALRGLLTSSLPESKAVDWEILKDRTPFPTPAPIASERPAPPRQDPLPIAPVRSSLIYRPELGILDKPIEVRRIEKEKSAADAFEKDTKEWEASRDRTIVDHAAKLQAYHKQVADRRAETGRAPLF